MSTPVSARANYAGGGVTAVHVDVPSFNPTYFRQMFKHRSSAALMPLFAKSCDPAKEWTESMSAWAKLRKWLKEPTLVLHIGDGAHSRTAAFFAFHSAHENVNIDPAAKSEVIESWEREINLHVNRLSAEKAKAEDVVHDITYAWHNMRKRPPILLTFVHAHVDTKDILARLPKGSWAAAYTCACCHPQTQLIRYPTDGVRIVEDDQDWGVLSPHRRYQVLVPEDRPWMSGDELEARATADREEFLDQGGSPC